MYNYNISFTLNQITILSIIFCHLLLQEIKMNLDRFYNNSKRLELEVKDAEDVYLNFPYQVGIIMNDTSSGKGRKCQRFAVSMI